MTRTESFRDAFQGSSDHRLHAVSRVTTSRITLLSTKTAAGTSTSRQLHDLVRRHFRRSRSEHAPNEFRSTGLRPTALDDLHVVALHHELDFGARQKSESLTNLLRDRDPAFRRDLHASIIAATLPPPMHWTPQAAPWLLVAAALLILAAVIFSRQRASRVAVLFCAMIVLVAVWFGAFGLMFLAVDADGALRFRRLGRARGARLPAAGFDFTLTPRP